MPNLIVPADAHVANAAGINIPNEENLWTYVLEVGE
jgi:hypothetical protein